MVGSIRIRRILDDKNVVFPLGLANRGLGNLETAQDEKIDPAVKMRALEEGNQFYADGNSDLRSL